MVAIDSRNLSKRYILHPESPTVARHLLPRLFGMRPPPKELWALHDVTFQVEEGETFGIVGQNGAGKSTLLRILSGVTKPTSGSIAVVGRVASLLDLGAGFHPDLTGRENVYLNGAILGMSRREIDREFSTIAEFADIGEFIDSPVRGYSSGMFVRLGFSVAVHLEPEILLIDEVLAVGDETFQHRCLLKMQDFRRRRKTIVFVSHDLDRIMNIADRCLLVARGQVLGDGPPELMVRKYLELSRRVTIAESASTSFEGQRWGSREVEIREVEFLDARGCSRVEFQSGEPFRVRISYEAQVPIHEPIFGLAIHRWDGLLVCGPNTSAQGFRLGTVEGKGVVEMTIEALPLLPGEYHCSIAVYDHQLLGALDHHVRRYPLRVMSGGRTEGYGLIQLPFRCFHNGRELERKDEFDDPQRRG